MDKKTEKRHKKWLRKLDIHHNSYRDVIRPLIFHIKGRKCEKCDSIENIDLYHTDYKNQNINTIKVLCRKCHIATHKSV